MAETQGNALPFAEQIAFFKQKVNLPTQRWDDLGAHARGFMLAGAKNTPFSLSWGQGDLFPCGGWGSAPQILGENKRQGMGQRPTNPW